MAKEQERSFGQKAVGLGFNPSGNDDVTNLKQMSADFIDMCNERRQNSDDPDVKRMLSLAITAAQEAQMWSVKAATWQA